MKFFFRENSLRIVAFTVLTTLLSSTSCNKSDTPDPVPPIPSASIIKGADISWLTEMESAGRKFYNSSGTEQDCIQILKNIGMNAVRLRVWVNPAGGWNGTADVVAKALRAKNLGMKVMIDFHYSDSWADPGQQTKPAAWAALDFTSLKNSVYTHTYDLLTSLKNSGITPEWVQVGNETNDGMLWPDGKASTYMANFAALVNKGYDAVKAVDANIKVIVHISNGHDNSLFRWIFDGLKNNGGKWDIIGMSLYPEVSTWSATNTQCLSNINDMIARYDKPVMITEVGMSWDQAAACQSFIADLINKVKSVANSKGLGVFYWEPQSYNGWKGYTKGAFDNSGRPTSALNAFN